jgi:outer membrane protein assembly factor BamB
VNLEYGSSCAGATDGSLFYAGTAKGWYYSVSLDQALKVWTGYTADSIDVPMEYFAGVVYVASGDGTILAARAGRTNDMLRKKTMGGRATAPFYVDARGCFVPCADDALWAFTSDLTAKLWDHPFACKGLLRHSVQVGEKTVFQRAEEDKLYAINLVDGQQRWSMAEGLQVLAAVGTDVYVRATGGRLLQVDEVLGTTKASATLGGLNLFAGNATEPMIFAGTGAGKVVCLKPFAAGQVTPQMLKQATK